MRGIIERIRRVKHPEWFEEEEKKEEDSYEDGIHVPSGYSSDIGVKPTEKDESLSDVDKRYPLEPNDPEEGETVYAWAHITWDERTDELIYKVIEPELDQRTERILERIQEVMERSLDVSFTGLNDEELDEYVENKIDEIAGRYNISITKRQKKIITYYTKRDFIGLGKLQPLLNDKEIEDISCDGSDIPVYVYHRNPKFGSIKTNVSWETKDELDSFVMKLAQRCGKSVSVSNPLVDGSLPDGSRVQATLSTDIARRGSNFTIRRFTEDPLTPVHMMEFETENKEMYSYLWSLIQHQKSVLICGTTGAGKTSQLNSLSMFIKPEKKIVSIEDTPELRLPHDHWVPEVARSGFGSSVSKSGEVSMDNLLKESLRQRPEYIIVGEVRGEEAYILFQQMATGHTGLSTIHADSLDMLIDRLTTNPINLSGSLIENLDCIMMIKRLRRDNKYVRRITGLHEVLGFDEYSGIESNKVFEWDPKDDKYIKSSSSMILDKIRRDKGLEKEEIISDLSLKQKVLEYMLEEQIKNYKEVGEIISLYYSDKSKLIEKIQ